VGNATSLLASDIANRATTFLLYALVARYLGAFHFGQLAVALTLLSTCQFIAVGGLKMYGTREVTRDRDRTNQFLMNGSLVVLGLSVLCISFLAAFVRTVNYSHDTAGIIVLLSLALIPYSLSAITEAIFQAWERMQYIAYANLAAQAVKVGGAVLVIQRGHGLYGLALVILAAHLLALLINWLFLLFMAKDLRFSLDSGFARHLLKSGSPFLGMDVAVGIMGSANIVLLSKVAGESEAGLYNATTQLMVPIALLLQNGVLSALPALCRKFEPSFRNLKRMVENLIEVLLAIALPAALGLALVARPALLLLYDRPEFAQAATALRIIVWTLVLGAMTPVLTLVLVASHQEKTTLRILLVDLVACVVLGAVLIPWLGASGAALALLLTKLIDFVQQYKRVRALFRITVGRLAWRPAVASACMAVPLLALRGQSAIVAVAAAVVLYFTVLFALAVWSAGGTHQLRAQYVYGWSD
jgi:O-antigen/teichoic acid export membrane protein